MTNRFTLVALLGLALAASPLVSQACCPSDGNGIAAASSGLGESYPSLAQDLAADSSWKVYEFQRDGIRYLQINDSKGVVRTAVGRIDDTFWVLPIGVDANRVFVPGGTTSIPTYYSAKRVYRSEEIEVWLYQTSSGDWWAVKPASTF